MEISGSTRSARYGILLPYCLGLSDPASNTGNLQKARELFDSVTPQETMDLVDSIIRTVVDMDQAKVIVTRMLHSFTKSLTQAVRPFARDLPFIESLVERNARIAIVLDALKPVVAQINKRGSLGEDAEAVVQALVTLDGLIDHYVAKENLLFPVIEHAIEEHRCVQLMWAIHDDIRATLAELRASTNMDGTPLETLNKLFGRLFFDMRSMIFREEQVLFPVIVQRIPRTVLENLATDQYAEGQVDISGAKATSDGRIDLITGNPTVTQLLQIFNNLPVDLTLVDEHDRVVYFNTPGHRIFPRTKAVVGRTVQNCHPPKSVHIVQRILDSFRDGTESKAEFRIHVKGRFILISYVAIRNDDGSYAGTLEVSQDITGIKEMEGEKRLLDWGAP